MKIEEQNLLHLPLEVFEPAGINGDEKIVIDLLNEASFIIHGNLRNARFFTDWLLDQKMTETARGKINLAADSFIAGYLEDFGIPAIMPKKNAEPIDLIEFLLRISTTGSVFYPTSDQKTEEIPGLLKELEMPVFEFSVCKQKSLDSDLLNQYKEKIASSKIDTIIFYNRSSVVRIQTAFPDLPFDDIRCIAADRGVALRMEEEGIRADEIAAGSWNSLAQLVIDYSEKDT